jgi:hypothetical protein
LSGLENLTATVADGYNVEFNFGQRTSEMLSNGFTTPGQCDWQMDVYSTKTPVNGENQFRIFDNYAGETCVSLRKGGQVVVGNAAETQDDYGFELQVYDNLYVNGLTHHNDDVHMLDGDIIFTAETTGISGAQYSDGIIWNSTSDSVKLVFEETSLDESQFVMEFSDNANISGSESFKIAFTDQSLPDNRSYVFDLNSGELNLNANLNVVGSVNITGGDSIYLVDISGTELFSATSEGIKLEEGPRVHGIVNDISGYGISGDLGQGKDLLPTVFAVADYLQTYQGNEAVYLGPTDKSYIITKTSGTLIIVSEHNDTGGDTDIYLPNTAVNGFIVMVRSNSDETDGSVNIVLHSNTSNIQYCYGSFSGNTPGDFTDEYTFNQNYVYTKFVYVNGIWFEMEGV